MTATCFSSVSIAEPRESQILWRAFGSDREADEWLLPTVYLEGGGLYSLLSAIFRLEIFGHVKQQRARKHMDADIIMRASWRKAFAAGAGQDENDDRVKC